MKVSYNWLKEFLGFEMPASELVKHFPLMGFDVDSQTTVGAAFTGVVIGEILKVDKHPNADRLSLCEVSTGGSEKLKIVCGAKNVAVGARVPVAKIGAKLPGGLTIARTKIRGTESEGMICSATELGLATPDSNGGIMILPAGAALGEDASRLLGEPDVVWDIDVTPNRADCLSHYGLARELSVHFTRPVREPAAPKLQASAAAGSRKIQIHDKDACRRYIGREFVNVKVGPSPGWLAQRLQLIGLRPINNVVDITNYVLFEYGHPLHAFDSEKLKGDTVHVRLAKGESMKALDGKDYRLDAGDLVIADQLGPVAIAGIMGGVATGVTDKTTKVFLEAAYFKPSLVRKTSSRLGLRSDSSYRFERGADPEMAARASARAAQLLVELCKAAPGEAADSYPNPPQPDAIEVSTERINQILGSNFPSDKINAVLKGISSRYAESAAGRGLFTPPTHRGDLTQIWDLAEEVARHLGYDAIGTEAGPVRLLRPRANGLPDRIRKVREALKGQGFSEAYNYDFVSAAQLKKSGIDPKKAGAVQMLNPLSEDWAYLRPSLFTGLLQSALHNLSRGIMNVRLFEIGRTYAMHGAEVSERNLCAGILVGQTPLEPHWKVKPMQTDLYDAKGTVAEALRGLDIAWSEGAGETFFHPRASIEAKTPQGTVAAAGLLHPELYGAWDLPQTPIALFSIDMDAAAQFPELETRLNPISPFPSSTRDLSFIVDAAAPYAEIQAAVAGAEALVRLDLIDIYAGKGIPEGKKSVTIRLTFSRPDRTLRDEEVESSTKKAVESLTKRCGAVLRG